ncbi:G2/M phase-specific E3 ubiquitin-protein ligase-like [Acipenser oxyrinchus oxyrinchus]|uniref:G2/M phase-specific E3 ubiquitin-protein ligase-like n=1 Tax=Acipenser oxyrinchus oxyrinchus TaxID=40147 RepID=A0AAD8FY90_ACIOX|nr:G2/M phase-specific E3 ubiquitin-protein ligase-like [Acipenser oxyrinchus oxyrinchus]
MKKNKRAEVENFQNQACVFCKLPDDCPEKYGEKKTCLKHNITLHYFCLLMSSGVYQRGEENEGICGFLVEDIQKEINRSSKLACHFCKKRGASVGCSVKECRKSFHFPCGLKKECIFQFTEMFPSFCWIHRPVQSTAVSSRLSGPYSCTICLEFIEPALSYSVLKCPCCNSSWFHRDCVQHQAYSAGMFFFRCTICNNKDKFQQEMLRMGIYIPERDASWELEENAYSELLQSYQHCDVRHCFCRKGREYSQPGSKWEIVRCQYCGSRGTHRSCSSLKRLQENWVCTECRAIIHKTETLQRTSVSSLASSPMKNETAKQLLKRSPKGSRLSAPYHRDIPSRQSLQTLPAMEILKELEVQINPLEFTRFTINKDDAFRGALCALRRKGFDPHHLIAVKFTNTRTSFEIVANNHGQRREFLRLLMHKLENSSLFEGSCSKNLALDPQALREDLYYDAGRMIGLSLVHGGPAPGFFSKMLFNCVLYGPENIVPIPEDLADACAKQKVKKIEEALTQDELQTAIKEASEYLAVAGCLRPDWTLCDKEILMKDILNFHLITRMHVPIQRFCEGLKILGLLEKIQLFPEAFAELFCHKPQKLTSVKLGDLFTVHYSLDGNRKLRETKVIGFWRQYLQDCEDSACPVSLETILVFATAADAVPPIGFVPEPSIEFLHSQGQLQEMFPQGETSFNSLKLPIVQTYEEFRRNMDYAICYSI